VFTGPVISLAIEDVEDVVASLAFEGGTVCDSTRALFLAVARGELTLRDALDRHSMAPAA
jgi:hypothetical protein